MIDDIISDAEERMTKSLGALDDAFKRIRTGRAHPVFWTASWLLTTVLRLR